jgi:hypothetical protein
MLDAATARAMPRIPHQAQRMQQKNFCDHQKNLRSKVPVAGLNQQF